MHRYTPQDPRHHQVVTSYGIASKIVAASKIERAG
jgi:hypothetical protein